MITSQQKIQLMRQYEVNPTAAILALAEMLKRETAAEIQAMKQGIIDEAVTASTKSMISIEKMLESIKGQDGEDADPEEVAQILLDTPSFFKMAKGDKGDKGESVQGPPGPQGPRGNKPVAGVDYRLPQDGYTPKKHVDYFDGEPGAQGEPGKDGSPDEPLEIAEKLNTTKESVDMSVIKGLEKALEIIRQTIREKMGSSSNKKPRAGGGGNIVEYYDLTSQCDGVTKTFAIPSNRRVLSVHSTEFPVVYRPVVDWTSVGKLLTLTSQVSAPASGQTLYLIFIR